jgi:hypothetical protein
MLVWLDAWEAAAATLSKLSLEHKDNLVGFAINDFEGYVESADFPAGMDATKLSRSDIKRIYDACHGANPAFGFYPVWTFPALGRSICRGLILGVNYGVRFQSGDSMIVEYNVPLLPDPVASRLTFFQHTGSERYGVYRSVRVNGVPAWPAPGAKEIPLNNTGRPEVEHTSLALKLHSGMNRIQIRIDSETFTNGCGKVDLWYVWDVKLQYWMAGSKRPIDVELLPRFETTPSSTLYYANPGCMGDLFDEFPKDASGNVELHNDDYRCVHKGVFGVPHLSDDPIKGRMARRLICAPNDSYLLEGMIDGILPYVSDTVLYGDSDALDPSHQIDRLLSDTKAELGNALLIPMHTAMTNVPINPNVLVHRLRVSAEATGAAGVYRFPLGMCFMDLPDRRGIFAPYDPGQLTLQWPTDQNPLPGWFQEWVHVPPPTTTVEMTVDIHDSRNAVTGDQGNLLKTVKGGGLTSAYEVDPFTDDDGDGDPVDWVTIPPAGSLLSSVADPVRVGLRSSGSVPVNTKVYAVAHDSSGTEIPATQWKFKSGVTDPNTLAIYHRLVDFFARVALIGP